MASPNWHWKSKQVTSWAKEWFQSELKVSIDGDNGQTAAITSVEIVDGDVELGQRKSKLIAIYDVELKFEWSGKASDGTEVEGKLQVPEVSHEITLDRLHDYVFNWELRTASSKPVDELYALAKKRLSTALETKFAEFPTILMSTHGKDITVSTPNSQDPSRSGTPVPAAGTSAAPVPVAPKPKPAAKKATNTTTVSIDASFMISADDLFSILTDEKRIPQWTRNAAVSNPTPGSAYSLFGGNIKGTYTSVTRPSKFAQTWSLQNPDWPSGHFATLTTTLDQGSDSTTVTWSMAGVPTGQEEEIKKNLQGYYIGGLNSIGCVPLPPSIVSRSPSTSIRPSSSDADSAHLQQTSATRTLMAIVIVLLALFAAFATPYLSR